MSINFYMDLDCASIEIYRADNMVVFEVDGKDFEYPLSVNSTKSSDVEFLKSIGTLFLDAYNKIKSNDNKQN